MTNYIFRRLLLLPLTLFVIILVNFTIINMAPGDPTTVSLITPEGAKQEDQSVALSSDDRYLQFREHYGLTLPILLNSWYWLTPEEIEERLEQIHTYKQDSDASPLSFKEYDEMRIRLGDTARFQMKSLLDLLSKKDLPFSFRQLASSFFVRGATLQSTVGPNLPPKVREQNQIIAQENRFLRSQLFDSEDSPETIAAKSDAFVKWYERVKEERNYEPSNSEQWFSFFFETRLSKYLSRVVTLDFGTLRNDDNKRVIDEVIKRFPISLTLAVIPMVITFVLCQFFGFLMAFRPGLVDRSFTLLFLMLYAIPVFVAAPFLIEKVALHHTFPFTDIPIPTHGFTSPARIYDQLTSSQRLLNIMQHIAIPLVAILYGNLAAQSRLTRTLVLEIKKLDYIRTAYAKGLTTFRVAWKHIGRNAAIILITALAGSLPVVLGGSLIVETLFEINGFGRFFYEGIINRDYNVVMFSALAGSFLTLIGYLGADISYAALDPRVTFD